MSLDSATLIRRTFDVLSPTEIAAAYNAAYAHYVQPFVVDAVWAANNMARHDINSHASSVWYTPGGDIAALSVLGQRDTHGWIGGFGIASDLRGQGLSSWLIDATITNARAAGVQHLWLEVITTNAAAIRVYERAGFQRTRTLLVLRAPSDAPIDATPESGLEPIDLHAAQASRMASTARPAWQRTVPYAAMVDPTTDYRASQLPDGSGLIVTTGDAPGARISDISADTPEAAAALLHHVRPPFIAWPTTLLNEPEGSAIASAALQAGWVDVLQQYEMVFDLG